MLVGDEIDADAIDLGYPNRLEIRHAVVGWADLEELASDIWNAVTNGHPSVEFVREFSIDTRSNSVDIGLDPASFDSYGQPPAAFREYWNGLPITIHRARELPPLTGLGWDNNAPPVRGGNGWGHLSGSNKSDHWCTVGFKVEWGASSEAGLLTAGHCVRDFGSLPTNVYHRDQLIGETVGWTTQPHDFGLIDLNSNSDAIAQLYYGTGNTFSVPVVGNATNYAEGLIRCWTGRASGASRCGTIINSSFYGATQQDLFVMSPTVYHGDSGGPAYRYNSSAEEAFAAGIVTAGVTDTYAEKWTNRPALWSVTLW